jgi:hypothetical protein
MGVAHRRHFAKNWDNLDEADSCLEPCTSAFPGESPVRSTKTSVQGIDHREILTYVEEGQALVYLSLTLCQSAPAE